jgi:hypothetical protein
MRVLVGGLIAGIILKIEPGHHSLMACLVAGALLTYLLVLLGPSSVAEKLGVTMLVSLLAWIAGPLAASRGLPWHLLGWACAGSALAFYLRPRTE